MKKRSIVARLGILVFATASLTFGSSAQAAHTIFSAPLTGAADLFTDFPSCYGDVLGPVGLLADANSFYATDFCNQTTYRFPLTGGSALTPAASAANGFDMGLAIQNGQYYGAVQGGHGIPAGVYNFDPVTLDRGSLVATMPGPRGLVADPLSGDLFVSVCSGSSSAAGLYRIQNPDSASPVVTTFAPGASGCMDGLNITSDGSRLYVVAVPDVGDERVIGFDRAGNVMLSVVVPGGPDGAAVARDHMIVGGIDVSNNVFVNTNAGAIYRIDTNNGNALSLVASGGSRGDFITVGPDGCMYATQSTTIERITPCFFQAPLLKTTLTADPAIAAISPVPTVFFPNLNAHLTAGGFPVVDMTVSFSSPAGEFICSVGTDATGTASCPGSLQATLDLGLGYTATFHGVAEYLPSSAHGPLVRVLALDVM